MKRRHIIFLMTSSIALCNAVPAFARAPVAAAPLGNLSRLICLTAPFPAVSDLDVVACALPQRLGKKLEQAVIVDAASRATTDGYSLFLTISSEQSIARAINPGISNNGGNRLQAACLQTLRQVA